MITRFVSLPTWVPQLRTVWFQHFVEGKNKKKKMLLDDKIQQNFPVTVHTNTTCDTHEVSGRIEAISFTRPTMHVEATHHDFLLKPNTNHARCWFDSLCCS